MNEAAKIRQLVSWASKIPGALDSCLAHLEQLHKRVEKGEALYKEAHWGLKGGRRPVATSVPDVGEGVVTVLGALAKIEYLTRKGRDREVTLYEHDFDQPLPLLCIAPEGSRRGLVVGRGNSKYTVNERGIVG